MTHKRTTNQIICTLPDTFVLSQSNCYVVTYIFDQKKVIFGEAYPVKYVQKLIYQSEICILLEKLVICAHLHVLVLGDNAIMTKIMDKLWNVIS